MLSLLPEDCLNAITGSLSLCDLKRLKFVCKSWYGIAWKAMKERYFSSVLPAFRKDVLLWSLNTQPVQVKSVKILQSGVYLTIKKPTPRGKVLNECRVRMNLSGYMRIDSNHVKICFYEQWSPSSMDFLQTPKQRAKWDAFLERTPVHPVPSVPPSVIASFSHFPTLLS